MATLRPVIVPAKVLKGGRHKLRISLAHNGDMRYIATSIIIDSPKEFRDGQIVKRHDAAILNSRLRGLLQKYQKAIDEAEYIEGLTCVELMQYIKVGSNCDNKTLEDVFYEYLNFSSTTQSTQRSYTYSYQKIAKVLGGKTLVRTIQQHTVLALDATLRKNLSRSSAYNIMNMFKTIVRYAVRCGYAQFRIDPFLGYKMPRAEVRQAWLTVEEIRMVRDFKTNRKTLAFSRDMFMLSYYLGGINAIDLANIDFNKNALVLKYERKKTERISKVNKYVEMRMPAEALEIARKYIGNDGRIMNFANRRCGAKSALENMKFIGKRLGIEKLIYYSARKSFAQHAFDLGANAPVIEYILGHSLAKGGTSLYHYISVTPSMATKTVRMVIDNLNSDINGMQTETKVVSLRRQ